MLLITTPTGNTGHSILRQIVQMGQPVRVLVRDPQKIPHEIRTQIEIVQGSLLDLHTLIHAMEGCETVYYCIPQSTTPTDLIQYYDDFAQTALQAIRRAGIKRVVYLGGAGKASGMKTAGAASALFHAEDVLTTSGVALRVLRCPVFFDNLVWQIPPILYTRSWGLPIAGGYKLPQVAVKDIAHVAVRWLTDTSWHDVRGVGVLGPEDISHDQIAEAVSEAMNKTVHFRQTTRDEYRNILVREGLSPVLADGVAAMFAAITEGLFAYEPRTTGTSIPTTIQQWLQEDFMPIIQNVNKR
jgi:uncharacterized protein YbjT (DUF2867 family)